MTGTDAANKAYVDSVASGLDVKNSVKVATTANITLSGTQTIDGVAVSAGNRVLVQAVVPMWVTPAAGQSANDFQPGDFVNFYMESGVSFAPSA